MKSLIAKLVRSIFSLARKISPLDKMFSEEDFSVGQNVLTWTKCSRAVSAVSRLRSNISVQVCPQTRSETMPPARAGSVGGLLSRPSAAAEFTRLLGHLSTYCLPSMCRFLEQGWLAVDAWARPLFLGSPCSVCGQPVCAADTCSIFFAKRFCVPCSRVNAAAFPPAVLKAAPRVFGAGQPQQDGRAPHKQEQASREPG